jgi:hypothetical protein
MSVARLAWPTQLSMGDVVAVIIGHDPAMEAHVKQRLAGAFCHLTAHDAALRWISPLRQVSD